MKEGDEDWGFATTKPGLTRETKIGLVMVLVLCCAFGFVLWKKFDRKRNILASIGAGENEGDEETDGDGTKNEKDGEAVEPVAENDDGDPFAEKTTARKPSRAAPGDFEEQGEPEGEPQQLFDPPPRGRASVATNGRGAPAPPGDFEDEPEPPAPGRTMARQPAGAPAPPGQESEPDDFQDPFGGPVARSTPSAPPGQSRNVVEMEEPEELQVTANEARATRGFGPNAGAAAPGRATPLPPGRAGAADEDFTPPPKPLPRPAPAQPIDSDPFGRAPRGNAASPPRGNAPPQREFDDFEPPVNRSPPTTSAGNAMPANRPAPFSRSADPFGGTASDAPSARGTVAAHDPRVAVYEVQANDNYWTISKKQYGTFKYYAALAQANADRIPDPTKLRPGMKVLTPPPQTLEARFPQLFGKKEGAAYAQEDSGQPGLFHAKGGQPLYRIGKNDTLTTIAREHLGRSSRWVQIYELNREQLKTPEDLKIGTVLRLPLDASSVRMTNHPVERR